MTRRALRWVVFSALLATVIALAIHNSISNARLLADLLSPNPQTRHVALGALAERPDAYPLVQSLQVPARIRIAESIRYWQSPRAASLASTLLKDPSPQVREALVLTLAAIASREPETVSRLLIDPIPAQRSGLFEGAMRAGDAGLEVAKRAFDVPASRENGAALLVLLGERSRPFLVERLAVSSPQEALAAAEALARIPSPQHDPAVAASIARLYQMLETQADKDRALVASAEFPSLEMLPTYLTTLQDPTAPSRLREAAARAIASLRPRSPALLAAANDPDPLVAKVALHAFASNSPEGGTERSIR